MVLAGWSCDTDPSSATDAGLADAGPIDGGTLVMTGASDVIFKGDAFQWAFAPDESGEYFYWECSDIIPGCIVLRTGPNEPGGAAGHITTGSGLDLDVGTDYLFAIAKEHDPSMPYGLAPPQVTRVSLASGAAEVLMPPSGHPSAEPKSMRAPFVWWYDSTAPGTLLLVEHAPSEDRIWDSVTASTLPTDYSGPYVMGSTMYWSHSGSVFAQPTAGTGSPSTATTGLLLEARSGQLYVVRSGAEVVRVDATTLEESAPDVLPSIAEELQVTPSMLLWTDGQIVYGKPYGLPTLALWRPGLAESEWAREEVTEGSIKTLLRRSWSEPTIDVKWRGSWYGYGGITRVPLP
jgi:hypothetical protein